MCTVSFLARENGYALAMNRDEKLTRAIGLPPSQRTINGRTVLSPSEPGGGSWIALNNSGVTFALINWYSIPTQLNAIPVSRGEVVNAVNILDSADSTSAILKNLPLEKVSPFRLIGIFPAANEIFEWRWDLKNLALKKHPWRLRQWISSGFDEPVALRIRSETFRRALKQKSVGTLDWLRRLHRSHSPTAGPFSNCMHRSDAATVSYTEVTVSLPISTMRYFDVAPCQCARGQLRARTLELI